MNNEVDIITDLVSEMQKSLRRYLGRGRFYEK